MASEKTPGSLAGLGFEPVNLDDLPTTDGVYAVVAAGSGEVLYCGHSDNVKESVVSSPYYDMWDEAAGDAGLSVYMRASGADGAAIVTQVRMSHDLV
jgi:hypothetical protein